LLANPFSPKFKDSDWEDYKYEMKSIVDCLTKELRISFKEFILKVTFPPNFYDKKLCLDKNALFLNFNYTDTLEYFYKIKSENVIYIHGKAKDKNSELILGHGISPNNFKVSEPTPSPNFNEQELVEWYQDIEDSRELSYELGKEELMSYFAKSFKQTNQIIEENRLFFNGLKNIRNIFVLGHSLSNIDEKYIIRIIESVNIQRTIWTVSYFDNNKKSSIMEKLLDLGLSKSQIILIKMDHLKLGFWNCFFRTVKTKLDF
jgi:hypothetical protein